MLFPGGRLSHTVTPIEARQMIRDGIVEPLGNRRVITAVQYFEGPTSIPSGQHYSHKHETDTNPSNCWELSAIADEDRIRFVTALFPPQIFVASPLNF